MSSTRPRIEFHFDSFTVQPEERRLFAKGVPVAVGPRAFDVLLLLVENAGNLVTKTQLLRDVWRGVVVEEANLHVQVSTLRKILGPSSIETVQGMGYRFLLAVVARSEFLRDEPLARSTNLPRRLTPFVGREMEVATLVQMLGETRLLTLTGIGGSGKTRLAIRLAELVAPSHPNGIWFVDLAPIADAERMPLAIADAIGVRNTTPSTLEPAIRDRLTGIGVLLILDNCEHLRRVCGEFAQQLLEGAFDLQIVATSREALGVPGERQFAVGPMSLSRNALTGPAPSANVSEAVQLFVALAKTSQPSLVLEEANLEVIGDICKRLNGIPLAIELAAARLKVLSLRQVRENLDDYLSLLVDANLPNERHRRLEGVFRWSYEHLEDAERAMLRRCSAFAGGWSLEAAAAVAGRELSAISTADLLSALADKSLVCVEHHNDAPARYTMLETVRQYMHARLVSAGEEQETRRLHFGFYLALAEAADQAFQRGEPFAFIAALDRERDNLVAAHKWCDRASGSDQPGLRLVNAMRGYWVERHYVPDLPPVDYDPIAQGYRLIREALDRTGARGRDVVRCIALAGAAQLSAYGGRFAESLGYLEESLDIAREVGDRVRVGWRLTARAYYLSWIGQVATALQAAEEALRVAREIGDRTTTVRGLQAVAFVRQMAGDLVAAERFTLESLELARRSDFPPTMPQSLWTLGAIAIARDDDREAIRHAKEFISFEVVTQDYRYAEDALGLCATIAGRQSDWRLTARFGGASLRCAKIRQFEHTTPHDVLLNGRLQQSLHALGSAEFDRIKGEGAALTVKAAITEGREWLSRFPDGGPP